MYGQSNASYQVTLDGSIRDVSNTGSSLLFSTSGETIGTHNFSIIANPSSSDQVLSLNQAIVTSEVTNS